MLLHWPVLTLALIAAALLPPSLVLGTHVIHTSPQNLTCAAQFTSQPTAKTCHARDGSSGDLTVEVESEQPTMIVLRRFFCPGWRLGDGLAIAPPIRTDLDRPSRQPAIIASI